MIETREQYEYLKKLTENMMDYGMQQDIIETIEALREVARAGRELLIELATPGPDLLPSENELIKQLAALPDWITDDGR